ncbi:hypothetical protein GCM10010176_031270 [Nonomuraea spiralis]|nr:hypothetical protein GCM10010176_031270 [Nonomuraea spiralis]
MQCDAQWCVGMLDEHVLVQLRVYEPDRYKSGVPIAMLYDLATGTTAGVGERSVGVLSGNVGAVTR